MDELTNWPKKPGMYKVVLMEIEGKLHARFPDFSISHAGIIEETARKLERGYPIKKNTEGDEVPALASDWYKIFGAGWSKIDAEKKTAIFSGGSVGYEIFINKEFLERLKSLHPDWRIEEEDDF